MRLPPDLLARSRCWAPAASGLLHHAQRRHRPRAPPTRSTASAASSRRLGYQQTSYRHRRLPASRRARSTTACTARIPSSGASSIGSRSQVGAPAPTARPASRSPADTFAEFTTQRGPDRGGGDRRRTTWQSLAGRGGRLRPVTGRAAPHAGVRASGWLRLRSRLAFHGAELEPIASGRTEWRSRSSN